MITAHTYTNIHTHTHTQNDIDNIKITHGTTAIKITSPKNGKQNPNIGTVLLTWVITGLILN